MPQLNDAEKEALSDWLVFALTNLKCDSKQVELLKKYIQTLIKLDSPPEKFKTSLSEFIEDKTDVFVDELIDRLNTKNFSFKKERPPPPPPKKVVPPPKQQESTAKPQTRPPPPKQNISESKKETKPASNITKPKPESSERQVRKEEVSSKPPPKPTQSQQKPPQSQQKPSQPHQQPQQNTQNQKSTAASLFDEGDIDDDGEEPPSDETIEKISEEKIDSKSTEPPPHYVIFIAGIDHNNSSIQTLFSTFTKYGRILAIEVNDDDKVAYIEFEELLSAFKAIKANNKKNLFKNAFIQADYAIPPDPEKLAELESEYNKRKQQRQEKKQQMLQQQLEQQKKESEAMSVSKSEESILEEEDKIKKDIIQRINEAKEELKKCTDPAKIKELNDKIEEFQTMISDL